MNIHPRVPATKELFNCLTELSPCDGRVIPSFPDSASSPEDVSVGLRRSTPSIQHLSRVLPRPQVACQFARITLRHTESLFPWPHQTPPTTEFLLQLPPELHSTWPAAILQLLLKSHRLTRTSASWLLSPVHYLSRGLPPYQAPTTL